MTAALGSSLASSAGIGRAAGAAAGAEAEAEAEAEAGAEAGAEAAAGVVAAGAAVDVEPESCKGGLGGSEAGAVAAVEGLAFQKEQIAAHQNTLKTNKGVKFPSVYGLLSALTFDTITTTKFLSSILYSLIGVSSWRIFPAYINF